jgi:hypothetical protein
MCLGDALVDLIRERPDDDLVGDAVGESALSCERWGSLE